MRQADTVEIEITLEMIEAGVAELARFNSDISPLAEGVEQIITAALDAMRFKVTYK